MPGCVRTGGEKDANELWSPGACITVQVPPGEVRFIITCWKTTTPMRPAILFSGNPWIGRLPSARVAGWVGVPIGWDAQDQGRLILASCAEEPCRLFQDVPSNTTPQGWRVGRPISKQGSKQASMHAWHACSSRSATITFTITITTPARCCLVECLFLATSWEA